MKPDELFDVSVASIEAVFLEGLKSVLENALSASGKKKASNFFVNLV